MAEEVKIRITAEDNFSGVLGNFGNIITGIRSAISLATDAFQAVVTPVIDFGKEALLTASRVDELSIVNEILAKNAGIAVNSIAPLTQSMREEGIQADIAKETIAQMIRANLDLANATDLARVAQDAAVIEGTNSSETLANIIYGITTLNPLVLRHAGIIVDLQLAYKDWADANDRTVDSMTTAEKQQVALNEVLNAGAAIAGSYETAMGNAFKQIGSFERYINDIYVAVGQYFQPAFSDAVFAIADFLKWLGKAVDEGGVLQPLLEDIAAIAEVWATRFADALAVLPGLIENVMTGDYSLEGLSNQFVQAFQDVDWGAVTDAIVTGIDNVDWSKVGVKLGEGLREAMGIAGTQAGEVDWFALIFAPIKAAGEFLAGWFAGFWNVQVSASLEEALNQWKGFFVGLWDWIRNFFSNISLMDVILYSLNVAVGALLVPFQNFIASVKALFGISSPSTVFFQIGVDIITGLINGITAMIGGVIAVIQAIVSAIMSPLQPVFDLLGIGGGNTTTGTHGTAGTISSGALTPAAQTVNNYYYGPVYFGAAGEPGAYYDCPSPNPLMTAGSGQLGVHTTGR